MPNQIRIEVNGEPRTAQADLTVAGLLQELAIRPERVAVELNFEVLDRTQFERSLRDGDRIEIISFIGGGAMNVGVTQAGYEHVASHHGARPYPRGV